MVQTLQSNMTPELVKQAQIIQALEQQALQQSIVPVSANAAPSALPDNAPAAAPAEPAVDAFLAALQVDFEPPPTRPLKQMQGCSS